MAKDRISKRCPTCGRNMFNWCTYCTSMEETERLPALMDKHNLTLENLVKRTASQIKKGSFPALDLAYKLRGINVAKRIEFEGKIDVLADIPDEDLDRRILELLNRLEPHELTKLIAEAGTPASSSGEGEEGG